MKSPGNGFNSDQALPSVGANGVLDSGEYKIPDDLTDGNIKPVLETKGRSTDGSIRGAIRWELNDYIEKSKDSLVIRIRETLKGYNEDLKEEVINKFVELVYLDIVDLKAEAGGVKEFSRENLEAAFNILGRFLVHKFFRTQIEIFFLELERVNSRRAIVKRAIELALGKVHLTGFGGSRVTNAEKFSAIKSYLIEGFPTTIKIENGLGNLVGVKPYASRKGHFMKLAKEALEMEEDLTFLQVELVGADEIESNITRQDILLGIVNALKAYAENGNKKYVIVFSDEEDSFKLDLMVRGLLRSQAHLKAFDLQTNLERVCNFKLNDKTVTPRIKLSHTGADLTNETEVMAFVDESVKAGEIVESNDEKDDLAYWLALLLSNADREPRLINTLIDYMRVNYSGVFPTSDLDLFERDRLNVAISPSTFDNEFQEGDLFENVRRAETEVTAVTAMEIPIDDEDEEDEVEALPDFDIDVVAEGMNGTEPTRMFEDPDRTRVIPVEYLSRLRTVGDRLGITPPAVAAERADDTYMDPEEATMMIGSDYLNALRSESSD